MSSSFKNSKLQSIKLSKFLVSQKLLALTPAREDLETLKL
jgi:hypothetical protein